MTGEPNTRAEMLRDFLAGHDEPCPACGYNLRDLQVDRCPECGAALELRLGGVSAGAAWFTAGCVGLGAALGIQGLGMLLGMASGDGDLFFVTVLPVVVLIFSLGGWVSGRMSIGRASAARRGVLTAMAVASPVVLPLLTLWAAIVLSW